MYDCNCRWQELTRDMISNSKQFVWNQQNKQIYNQHQLWLEDIRQMKNALQQYLLTLINE
jgi:hypothetical protein